MTAMSPTTAVSEDEGSQHSEADFPEPRDPRNSLIDNASEKAVKTLLQRLCDQDRLVHDLVTEEFCKAPKRERKHLKDQAAGQGLKRKRMEVCRGCKGEFDPESDTKGQCSYCRYHTREIVIRPRAHVLGYRLIFYAHRATASR